MPSDLGSVQTPKSCERKDLSEKGCYYRFAICEPSLSHHNSGHLSHGAARGRLRVGAAGGAGVFPVSAFPARAVRRRRRPMPLHPRCTLHAIA